MITTNDILRSLRYSLNISDATVIKIFKLTGYELSFDQLTNLLKKEDEDGYEICRHYVLAHFLDGMIIYKRGQQEGKTYEPPKTSLFLSNNLILKKIRIALELQEDEMLEILYLAGFVVSKHELGAFFRKEGHHNYRECGDQFLRNFLKGLAIRYRHSE